MLDRGSRSEGRCRGEGEERVDEPILAWRSILRTLTHSAMAAPELSITLIIVCAGESQWVVVEV